MAPEMCPFIGVNADYLPPTKKFGRQVRLNVGYLDAIVTAGGMPVSVAPARQGSGPRRLPRPPRRLCINRRPRPRP